MTPQDSHRRQSNVTKSLSSLRGGGAEHSSYGDIPTLEPILDRDSTLPPCGDRTAGHHSLGLPSLTLIRTVRYQHELYDALERPDVFWMAPYGNDQ